MRTLLPKLMVFLAVGLTLHAGDVVLPYSAFGPQSASFKVIGMEWWQWQSHGDSRDREYPIEVVVYWDQSLEETTRKYPVNQDKLQDYRYVEFSTAVDHLQKTIATFEECELDPSSLKQTLSKLQKAKAEQLGSTE